MSLNFDWLNAFITQMNYLIDCDLHWHFLDNIDRHFSQNLSSDHFFLYSLYLNSLLHYLFNWLFDLDEYIVNGLHLLYHLLYHRNMHYLLYHYDSLSNDLLFNNFFNYLRHLHNFFDNSRHYHNFFDYFLDFHYLWYFNHFFYDFFNRNIYFLYSVHNSRYLNYFFLNILHHFRHFNIHIHILLHLYDNRLFDYKGLPNNNFFDVHWLDSLNHRFLHNKFFDDRHFLNDGYLYKSLNLNWNFFDDFNKSCFNCNHLFDLLLNDKFLFDDLDLLNLCDNIIDLPDNLYDLRHFFYLLSYLNYRHYLLDYTIHDLVFDFYMVFNFTCSAILYSINNFLHNSFHLYDFGDLDYFLDYLFNVDRHFDYSFNYFFDRNNLLTCNLYLFELSLNVIHYSFNLNWHFFLNYLLFKDLNLYHLRYYLLNFN